MTTIHHYLLSITCAGIICSIVISLFSKNTALSGTIKLVCGLFFTVVMISPLVKIRFDNYRLYWEDILTCTEQSVQEGIVYYEESMAKIITEQTQAYIDDKVAELKLSVTARVCVSEDQVPIPESVELEGSVSPVKKKMLTEFIQENLNIPEENIVWK